MLLDFNILFFTTWGKFIKIQKENKNFFEVKSLMNGLPLCCEVCFLYWAPPTITACFAETLASPRPQQAIPPRSTITTQRAILLLATPTQLAIQPLTTTAISTHFLRLLHRAPMRTANTIC
jgi:hypothetical protein